MSRRRWIPEKAEARGLESESVTEVLALALQLQSDAGGLLSEEQVIEMGRELGIAPHHVRAAMRLRQGVGPSASAVPRPTDDAPGNRVLAWVGRALLVLLGVGMAPVLLQWMAMTGGGLVALLALPSAAFVGWLARYPRLAALGGALTVPIWVLCYFFYFVMFNWGRPYPLDETIVGSLVLLSPYCAAAGAGAAALRRWLEQPVTRSGWTRERY